MNGPRFAWLGLGGLALTVGGCQLVSGLSGYQESSSTATGTGTATSSSAGGMGGMGNGSSVTTGGGGTGGCESCGLAQCIDTKTDIRHCGDCTKVCDALQICASGACMDTGPYDSVTAISANDTDVYWLTKTNTTTRIQHSTAPLWKVDDIELNVFYSVAGLAIAGDGKSVFFTKSEHTMGIPKLAGLYEWTPSLGPGGAVVEVSTATHLDTAGAIHADPDRVIWGGHDANWINTGMPQWLVYTTYLALPVTTESMPHPTQDAPLFADDIKYVYWPYTTYQFEQSLPPTSLDSWTYMFPTNTIAYLAADSDPTVSGYLYWFTEGSDLYRINKVPGTMNAPIEKAGINTVDAKGLVVSSGYIYWLEGGACVPGMGQLKRVKWGAAPISEASVESLQAGLTCPRNLALGGANLYYSVGVPKDTHVVRSNVLVP